MGSFYTPKKLADCLSALILKNVPQDVLKGAVLLDSSCGSGNLLDNEIPARRKIGADIDAAAVDAARARLAGAELHCFNALKSISRKAYSIEESDALVIIGNPPYNDRTSIVQSRIKECKMQIDPKVECNDIGISFLLSYNELRADYACLLHPLSYLIKRANFSRLKGFAANYVLQDAVVVSSEEFCPESLSFFPIVIAVYRRQAGGMSFDYIREYSFSTCDHKTLRLGGLDFIGNYIDKYPNGKRVNKGDAVAMFYTMRDINALKRSRTFIERPCANAVYVLREKYSLYCYVDVFKKFAGRLPYFLGNCDVFIDYEEFKKCEDDFVACSKTGAVTANVSRYFDKLFEEFA